MSDLRRVNVHDVKSATVDHFPGVDFSEYQPGDNVLAFVPTGRVDSRGHQLNRYGRVIRNAHNRALDTRQEPLPAMPQPRGILAQLLAGRRLHFVFEIGLRWVDPEAC